MQWYSTASPFNRRVAAQEPLKLGFSPGSSFEILRSRWEIYSVAHQPKNSLLGRWELGYTPVSNSLLYHISGCTYMTPRLVLHPSHDQFLLFSQRFRWCPGIAGTAVSVSSSCESWQALTAAKDHLRNATSKHKESPGSNDTDWHMLNTNVRNAGNTMKYPFLWNLWRWYNICLLERDLAISRVIIPSKTRVANQWDKEISHTEIKRSFLQTWQLMSNTNEGSTNGSAWYGRYEGKLTKLPTEASIEDNQYGVVHKWWYSLNKPWSLLGKLTSLVPTISGSNS